MRVRPALGHHDLGYDVHIILGLGIPWLPDRSHLPTALQMYLDEQQPIQVLYVRQQTLHPCSSPIHDRNIIHDTMVKDE